MCFICKQKGHWASKCPQKTRTKFGKKVATVFSATLDPTKWDLLSLSPLDFDPEFSFPLIYSYESTLYSPSYCTYLTSLFENDTHSPDEFPDINFLSVKMLHIEPPEETLLASLHSLRLEKFSLSLSFSPSKVSCFFHLSTHCSSF
jgi:hypothetical protein